MKRGTLAALILALGWIAWAGEEIPLPEGAEVRLGLGWITDVNVKLSPGGKYLAVARSIGKVR